jgi:hypothetical protein
MQWTPCQTESGDKLQNLKISSQGEIVMSPDKAEDKGGKPQGNKMRDKGKLSFVTTAERSDTLHKIAGSQSTTITPLMQGHHETNKVTLKIMTPMSCDKL